MGSAANCVWRAIASAIVTNCLDVGVDGVLGLEYTFPKAPVSVFLDGTLYMELFDDPFLFSLQGGTGVRFRF